MISIFSYILNPDWTKRQWSYVLGTTQTSPPPLSPLRAPAAPEAPDPSPAPSPVAEAGAGAGAGSSEEIDPLTESTHKEQLDFEYRARAKFIEHLFSGDDGIVIRMMGGAAGGGLSTFPSTYHPEEFIPFEFNQNFSNYSNPISATLLKKGFPIAIAPAGVFGFIYVPYKLYVEQAFSFDGMTRYGYRRGTRELVGEGEMVKEKIAGMRNFAAHGHTHHELGDELPYLDQERIARGRPFLSHNELTIKPFVEEEKKEAIVGILVRQKFAENHEELKRIYALVSEQKSNLPIFAYDYNIGELTLVPNPLEDNLRLEKTHVEGRAFSGD